MHPLRTANALLLTLALGIPAAAQPPPEPRERLPKQPLEYERHAETVKQNNEAPSQQKLPPLRSRSLQEALAAWRAAGATTTPGLSFSWGEFLAPKDVYFVAVQIMAAPEVGLVAGQKATLFGEVNGPRGAWVLSLEVERPVEVSRDRVYLDVPLDLAPGEYLAHLGIAQGGTVKGFVGSYLAPQEIAPRTFGLSRLMISDNVFPLPAKQEPDQPFAFGGIKVVPRSDGIFHPSSEAWLFLVVRSPSAEAGGTPQLGAKVTIIGPEGPSSTKRELKVQDPAAIALQGFEHQFGLGLPLTLTALPAGGYQVEVVVIDLAEGNAQSSSSSFTLARP